MVEGTYATWTGEDFSYRGQIVSMMNDRVILNTELGIMEFPADDGNLTPSRKVSGLAEVAAPKPAPVAKAPKAGSRKAQAIDVIKAYFDEHDELPARKAGIALLVAQLGMTAGGASTYFNEAKKVVVLN